MDSVKFQTACNLVVNQLRESTGIGTLSEKTLHAILKLYFEPDSRKHEIKVGRYIADIVGENGIIEIQTRNFNKLRDKLSAFLPDFEVTVVYPIARKKYLRWINPENGEVSDKRKSPKTGQFYDAFSELYKIKPMLNNPNLHICLVLIDLTEYRYLNGWSKDKKKGSSRCERIPDDIADEMHIDSTSEYSLLVPPALPSRFTAKEFAKTAHLTLRNAQTGLNILSSVGAVVKVGKRGREYEYKRQDNIEN